MPSVPSFLHPASSIADALGAGYVAHDLPSCVDGSFAITTPEGHRFHVVGPAYGRAAHYLIVGHYAARVCDRDDAPSVRVAVSKSPEQIARDIARRFLPSFLPLAARKAEEFSQSVAEQADRFALVTDLAHALGVRPPTPERLTDCGRRLSIHGYFPDGSDAFCSSFTADFDSHRTAQLQIRGDLTQIAAICRAVVAMREPAALEALCA